MQTQTVSALYDLYMTFSEIEPYSCKGQIRSFTNLRTGVRSRPKRNLYFTAQREDRYGFTTWVVSLRAGTPQSKMFWRMSFSPHPGRMCEPGSYESLQEAKTAVIETFSAFMDMGDHTADGHAKWGLCYTNVRVLLKAKVLQMIAPQDESAAIINSSIVQSLREEALSEIVKKLEQIARYTRTSSGLPTRKAMYRALGVRVTADGKISVIGADSTVNKKLGINFRYGEVMDTPIQALGCSDANTSIWAYTKEGYAASDISAVLGLPTVMEVKRAQKLPGLTWKMGE
mgnify:CR=1 FL=1